MRRLPWIVILATLSVVLTIIVSRDPERAERLSEMYRSVAFTGETREMVIMLLALGLGAFIVYLAVTRR
ncbi:hypothetical protein DC522_04520 [Microvirga sp. KLBC 81]|uniref:hypothetical protein n=1 Tax=Microvirga sp. KLBC 81 TaxID=1862707 RepID=UPI000D5160A0|nr:hypothetical protein [Microvirga sp. KLBC 81]PVE25590.1 hypothetical protein DC522_04520 [Microvirga sp. KLBC 81]